MFIPLWFIFQNRNTLHVVAWDATGLHNQLMTKVMHSCWYATEIIINSLKWKKAHESHGLFTLIWR